MRADTELTVRTILEAAERVLRANPAATIEQVAEAAGVARTTVHRRFATRDALLDALAAWATAQFHAAIDAARPESTPPLIAMYQVTANVLKVKLSWKFAMSQTAATDPVTARLHAGVLTRCEDLLRRAQDIGLIRAEVDVVWARRVYHALFDMASEDDNTDVDAVATAIVHTLLHGIGTDAAQL
ncbi:hypothetical protein GCM10027436_46650 [Actinophytocola sediminis]